MADTPDISQAVNDIVSKSVEAHLDELRVVLRAEIVEKINEAVEPLIEAAAKSGTSKKGKGKEEEHAPGGGPTDLLNAAVASIYDAPGQGDILKALLEGLAQFTAR